MCFPFLNFGCLFFVSSSNFFLSPVLSITYWIIIFVQFIPLHLRLFSWLTLYLFDQYFLVSYFYLFLMVYNFVSSLSYLLYYFIILSPLVSRFCSSLPTYSYDFVRLDIDFDYAYICLSFFFRRVYLFFFSLSFFYLRLSPPTHITGRQKFSCYLFCSTSLLLLLWPYCLCALS